MEEYKNEVQAAEALKAAYEKLKAEISKFIASNNDQLEEFRLKFISRKSVIGDLFAEMKSVAPEERKKMGQLINEVKSEAQQKFKELIHSLDKSQEEQSSAPIDLTLPPVPETLGSLHPLSITRKKILEIFERIGFNVSYGPEIEDDWHNFTALNFPENHPAREMQDTFFIEKDPDIALRTHTSSVQVRVMEKQKPPIRTLSPGRVFRNEAISARSH